MVKRLSHSQFIDRSSEIHDYKYNYKKTIYKNKRTKICITCPIHGDFFQCAENHMSGQGCSKCGTLKRSETRISKKDFVKEAQKVHGDKYDYSISKYIGVRRKVDIICRVHGVFSVSAGNHIHRKSGCMKCSMAFKPQTQPISNEKFISRATKVHNNKYDYSKVIYKHMHSKIKIICKHHGEFTQEAHSHVKGHGCPTCGHYISSGETKWLDSLGITNRNVWIKLKHRSVNVDGFNPDSNTIYEFYGDYWHGNPNKYDAQDINKKNGKTFGELYLKTKRREGDIICYGYNIICIWESDWKSNSQNLCRL